jgi:hypothetical protein
MTPFLKAHWDKCLLVLVSSFLALSAGWVWQQTAAVRRIRAQPVKVQLAGVAYQPSVSRRPDSPTSIWPKPVEQNAGNGWLYEVFTPPIVYYNTKTRSFAVEPAHGSTGGATPFSLELIGVKPEPFRLQLAGYFGGPGDYVAAFVEPDRSDILLAREGRRFENLGLTLKSLTVGKVTVETGEVWPVYDVAAIAVLHDETTGQEVALDSRNRQLTGRFLAVVRLQPGDDDVHELREGETISEGGSIYRVDRIRLDPPEVAVVRQSPGLQPVETKILHPVPKNLAKASSPPATNARASGYSSPGLATNVK